MDQRILDYLNSQKVGVLAVEMPDGSPHAATVHFAYMDNPLVFFFETYAESRKAKALLSMNIVRASFVIGSNPEQMKTLQLDGSVQLLMPEEKQTFDSIYLGKFPEKKKKSDDGKFVTFKFTPSWWRFTDWTGPEGKMILTSGEK